MGLIGAARVGYLDGKFVVNPTLEQTEASSLDLVVAGTKEGVLMVESEAKELSEEVMLGAVMEAHRSFQPVIDAIIQLAEHCAKEPLPLTDPSEASKTVADKLKAEMRGKLVEAFAETQKQARQAKISAVKTEAKKLFEGNDEALAAFGEQFGNLEADVVRTAILDTGKRIDGRDTKTVRPIVAEVGVLPRAHGSSLFTRGETQALVVDYARRPGRTSRSSTRSKASTAKTSCCTTTSRRTRSVKCAAWGRPAAARSATASSPGARSVRCCPARTSSRTRSASCRRSPRATALRRWPRCAAARCR